MSGIPLYVTGISVSVLMIDKRGYSYFFQYLKGRKLLAFSIAFTTSCIDRLVKRANHQDTNNHLVGPKKTKG